VRPEQDRLNEAGHKPTRLKSLRLRGGILVWGFVGTAVCATGLILLTGLAESPWLFLLYPLLIGGLIASLGVLTLNLLRRL
jgi:hypothetical protein